MHQNYCYTFNFYKKWVPQKLLFFRCSKAWKIYLFFTAISQPSVSTLSRTSSLPDQGLIRTAKNGAVSVAQVFIIYCPTLPVIILFLMGQISISSEKICKEADWKTSMISYSHSSKKKKKKLSPAYTVISPQHFSRRKMESSFFILSPKADLDPYSKFCRVMSDNSLWK